MLASDITWPVVASAAVVLAAVCFLVVLSYRQERRNRKIRVGLFVEREYRDRDKTEETTQEWPRRKEE